MLELGGVGRFPAGGVIAVYVLGGPNAVFVRSSGRCDMFCRGRKNGYVAHRAVEAAVSRLIGFFGRFSAFFVLVAAVMGFMGGGSHGGDHHARGRCVFNQVKNGAEG